MDADQLWREFPKTALEFEARFGTDAACVEFLEQLRWSGHPRCDRCSGEALTRLRNGRFQCSGCRYQMSVTAGTVLHRTRKPIRLWFRAIWEMMTRKNGISAADLQRILGFGSYQTAWTWLHKLRRVLCAEPSESERLRDRVQVDESYIGGRDHGGAGGRNDKSKSLTLVAAERGGRARLAQAEHADEKTLGAFLDRCVDSEAQLVTDGWRGYSKTAVRGRSHEKHVQSGLPAKDELQHCHWIASLVKRWWNGTHHGGIQSRHTQAYFDEFVFRYNRRKTRGVGRLVARVLQRVVRNRPTSGAAIIGGTGVAPWFAEPTG